MESIQGISDEDFREILSSMSGWYDCHGYINVLKVLYRDLVIEPDKLYTASKVIKLFELLCTSGHLSSVDPTVLYDTINITQPFGLEPEIRKLAMKTFVNIRTVCISKFTLNRQMLIKVVKCLSDNDVKKISKLYNCSQEADRWELFVDLEQRREFCEENLDDFMRNITTYLIRSLHKDPPALMVTGDMDVATRKACPRTSTDDPGEMMVTGDTDVARREAAPSTSTGQLSVVNDTENPMQTSPGSTGIDYDFYIISEDVEWETQVLQELQTRRPVVKCLSRKDWQPGKYKIENLIKPVQRCKKVVVGFISQPVTGNLGFVVATAVQQMLDNNTLDQGKLIPVRITEDAEIPDYLEPITVASGWEEDFYDKLLNTLSEQADQKKFMGSVDKHIIPQMVACPRSSTAEVYIVNNMISKDNKGSITGSQFKDCNIGTVNMVNNIIQVPVPTNQESEDRGMSAKNSDMAIRDYLDQWQRKVYKNVNRMTPPTWNLGFEIDLAEVFTDLELLKGKKDGTACETTTTSLQEILYLVQSQKSCKVFVEGKGGMGKSTLLKHLAYCWANKRDDPFPGKLLFLVNLRDLTKDEDVLDVIVRQLNIKDFCRRTKLNKDLIVDFLNEHDDEIVLLLDGYDEVEASAEDPVSLFERKTFENSHVILASRPENVDNIVKKCDVHIKVEGFNPDKIKCYIQKHFESIKMPELGESLIKELHLDLKNEHKWGGKHAEAFEMCRCPMLLLKICTIWKENQSIPVDMPMLFKEIFRCILNQFINRSGADKPISRFEDAPEKYVKAMLTLGKCMFKALQNNRLSVDRNDLEGDEETIDLAIRLGYVYKDKAIVEDDFREIFNTPHKLISESLVGFYLSRQTQCFSNDEGDIIVSNQYLHMSRVFAIGFLGVEAGEFLKHWIKNSATGYCSLARYFQYVKKEYEEQVILVLDEYITTRSPDIKPHFEDICKSLRGLLQHVKQSVEVKEDEHLILLIRKIHQYVVKDVVFETAVKSWAKTVSNNVPSFNFGRMLTHIFIAIDIHQNLIAMVDKVGMYCHPDIIQGLSAEFQKFEFRYEMKRLIFSNTNLCASALVHVVHYAPKLNLLSIRKCGVSGKVINEMINEYLKTGLELPLLHLDIQENDLSDVDMASMASLLQIAPKLQIIMYNCCLSGTKARDLMTECEKKGVELQWPGFLYNDLSDIDGATLAHLFRLVDDHPVSVRWSECKLSSKNLQDLIHECENHDTVFNLTLLNIMGIDLSSISGAELCKLLKIFPKLNTLCMCNCNLSGTIIKDLLNECDRIGVMLKQNIFQLSWNDLSDIDSESLAKLLKIIDNNQRSSMTWTNGSSGENGNGRRTRFCYNLSVDHFRDLILHSRRCDIVFKWTELSLRNSNISTISGSTLASLFKICPNVKVLDMRWCQLTGKIISDFLKECHTSGVKLKHIMLHLEQNDLSDIDGVSLAQLLLVMQVDGWGLASRLRNFDLNSNNIYDMILESNKHDIVFNWTVLTLVATDLSAISGAMLACLFKICPKLNFLDLTFCNLSGTIIRDLFIECDKKGVILTKNMIKVEANDLSNIDGTSLTKLLQICDEVTWLRYRLSADNLHSLINECCAHSIELIDCKILTLSGINLSTFSGNTLSHLPIIFPKLNHLVMRCCSLSGGQVRDFLYECERRGVELKGNVLQLKDNDLSDIDGASLAKLLKCKTQCIWSDYKLNAGNVQNLIQECEQCKTEFQFTHLYLRGINLSLINGAILASLLKICPNLNLLDIVNCSLSGATITDLLNECEKRGVELKHNMLQLEGNDLSGINGASLTTKLLDIIATDYGCIHWVNYNLSADHLQYLIHNSLQSNNAFGWTRLDISGLDLAMFSGETLYSFFRAFQNLKEFDIHDCQLSRNSISCAMKMCSDTEVISALSVLNISRNDLSNLSVDSVMSMLDIFPKLNVLKMNNCRLSSDAFKHIANVCPNAGVLLPLTDFDISENDLGNLNGAEVVSLSTISPKLEYLNVSGCKISSQLLQDANELSQISVLGFTGLDLSDNDLHEITTELLFSILSASPQLEKLRVSNCRLPSESVQGLMRKCLHGQPSEKCELSELDLSYNNLSAIEESILSFIFLAFPHLRGLNVVSCQLTMKACLKLRQFWPSKPGCKYFHFK